MKEHLALLGYRVRDKVTGFEGVVTSVSFALYGCVQAIVTPAAKEDKLPDSQWFDISRLELKRVGNPMYTANGCTLPVMEPQPFPAAPHGPDAIPPARSNPTPTPFTW
jgi:hypothetical protein